MAGKKGSRKNNLKKDRDIDVQKILDFIKTKEFIVFAAYATLLLFLIAPTRTETYVSESIYQDTETYLDIEPYEVEEEYDTQEAYIASETYRDTVPISIDVPYEEEQVTYEKVTEIGCDSDPDCFCQRTGTMNGTVVCTECACQNVRTVTKYRTEVDYEEITKTRPVTKYRDVTRSRTVIRFREVNKTRTIAKVRTEEKQRNVNWIFGFYTPWKLEIFS